MKILQVHNEYREPGGEEKVVDAEARLLVAKGHEVISYRFRSKSINGSIDKLKTAWMLPYSKDSKRRMAEEIRKHRPDVMHVHNFFPIATPSIFEAAKEAGVSTILTLHNYRILCANGLLLRDRKPCELCVGARPWNAIKYSCYQDSRLGSLAMARMIDFHQRKRSWQNLVDKFIVLTEFAKSKYVKAGLLEEKFVVKPNFIFDPEIGSETSKSGPPKLLFVGRLSEEKGIETLLHAKKKLPNLELHIVGDGPLRGLVTHAASTEPGIYWHGFQGSNFIFDRLNECDALVFPSECYENFPITILEAMAMGRPVIASRIGGLPEIVMGGETGLFFEPGNSQDLISKIEYFIANRRLAVEMGQAALSRYRDHYGAEKNFQMLKSVYQSLVR